MFRSSFSNGQGTIEYLVIMAVIIVIGLLVVGMASTFLSSSSGVSKGVGNLNSLTGPISVSESVVDGDGDLIVSMRNNTGDFLTITSFSVGETAGTLNEPWPVGSLQNIYLEGVSGCSCDTFGKIVQCEFILGLTNVHGRSYTETILSNFECVTDTNGGNIITAVQPVNLSSCSTITESGTYILSSDISEIDGNCFTITANNVVLDGNNKTISSTTFGSLSFSKTYESLLEDNDYAVATADFDNDGDVDYVRGGQSRIRVYLNDGNGDFSLNWSDSAGVAIYDLAVGDFDGDGDIDLVSADRDASNKVYLNDGDATFTEDWVEPTNRNSLAVGVGDFDGDSDLDLIFGNIQTYGYDQLYKNDGGGNFTLAWTSLERESTNDLTISDFDSDGDLDFIVGNVDFVGSGENNFFYDNNGSGYFTASDASSQTSTRKVVSADFDNDGDMDYVGCGSMIQTEISIVVFINNGSGSFGWGYSDNGEHHGCNSIGAEDFDGDGDVDLVIGQTYLGNGSYYSKIYSNDGDATFTEVWESSELLRSYDLVVADFDGDTDPDFLLVLAYGSDNSDSLYKNNVITSDENRYGIGINASTVSSLTIQDLSISGFSKGINLSNVSSSTINGNTITNSSLIGLSLKNSSSNTFENNFISGDQLSLELLNSNNTTFNNNSFCSYLSGTHSENSRVDTYCYGESLLSGSDNNLNMNSGCSGFSWAACQ
jgi:parallel beta-helix repeat protein